MVTLTGLANALRISRSILRDCAPLPRGEMLRSFLRLRLASHQRGGQRRKVRILGWNVEYLNFDTLAYLFGEVLLAKSYYVALNSAQPRIVDCGSNIGISLLFFKTLYPQARILAFEPNPQSFQLLANNVRDNGISGIDLVNSAVAAEDGRLTFYGDAMHSTAGYASSDASHVAAHASPERVQPIEVQAVRLSSYITDAVDLLKLDVEGAELDVLEDLDRQHRLPLVKEIIMEFHHRANGGGARMGRLLDLLDRNGYGYEFSAPLATPFRSAPQQCMLIHAYRKGS